MEKTIIVTQEFKIFDNCLNCPHALDLSKPDSYGKHGDKIFKLSNSRLIISKMMVDPKTMKLVPNLYKIRCDVDGKLLKHSNGCGRRILISTKES